MRVSAENTPFAGTPRGRRGVLHASFVRRYVAILNKSTLNNGGKCTVEGIETWRRGRGDGVGWGGVLAVWGDMLDEALIEGE